MKQSKNSELAKYNLAWSYTEHSFSGQNILYGWEVILWICLYANNYRPIWLF